jgi:hypothetical protein
MERLEEQHPLGYLSVIGAELAEIEATVQADREEYESILRLPFFPKNGVIRCMATVYTQYKFEPLTPEAECIEILQAFSKDGEHKDLMAVQKVLDAWLRRYNRKPGEMNDGKSPWERMTWDCQ